jgi:hypothetical protein
VARII